MNHLLKVCLFSMLIAVSVTACKKAQEESAEAAKETITEMKANTIDAAKEAVAETERTANEIAEAAEQIGIAAENKE